MQSNDLHFDLQLDVSGAGSYWKTADKSAANEENEKFVNAGFRWLVVNEFVHVYTVTSLSSTKSSKGMPRTEILAYVQLDKETGLYRALRSMQFTSIEMNIPQGLLKDVSEQVENLLLQEGYTSIT